MALLLILPLLAVALHLIRTCWLIVKNVQKARKTGLPYVVVPSGFWVALNGVLLTTRAFRYVVNTWLPASVADNLNSTHSVTKWTVKDRMTQRAGPCYLRVNQHGLTLEVSDADLARQIVSNRHQFPKPIHLYDLLTIYGPNIVASDNKDWPRHRHHAAPAFNEKNNNLVWKDALKQTSGMLQDWKSLAPDASNITVQTPQSYLNKIILHVLTSAGFGVELPYTSSSKSSKGSQSIFEDSATPPAGYSSTFRSVSQYMSLNFRQVLLPLSIVPKWIPRSLLPFFKHEFAAYEDMKNYLYALIQLAKDNDAQGRGSHNLLQLLVRSNEDTGTGKDYRLTPKELLGDVHIFTVAGFETTATTLRFALVLLALNPEKQRWVRQGIKEALEGQPDDPREWSYAEVFPKLVTPLCVMLETMRLFPPVVTVPKSTGFSSANINYNGKVYTVPPETNVDLMVSAMGYRQEYWGPDAHDFAPERWDARNKASFLAQNDNVEGLAAPGLEYPTVHKPVRGAFIPFSDGHRACLGKKFAQVEYVAIMALILREFEISLAKVSPDESDESAVKRARKALDESSMVLSLAMAGDVPLSFRQSRI